jgi:hypothetical protein
MSFADLTKPLNLEDDQWRAILDLIARLEDARSRRDWALAVGSSKELAETVAKIILDSRGRPFASNADFPILINDTHKALLRHPNEHFADDRPARNIAQSAKNLVVSVVEMRNQRGTGHGRPRPVNVEEEHADLASDAAVLWCRWALRRLDVIVEGRTGDLIRDLRQGEAFRGGDLARRLRSADIETLDLDEQHRLGVAVGQRAARRTVTVLVDGVEAAAAPDPHWTDAYRVGVVEGSFLNVDGYLQSTPGLARAALALLRSLADPVEISVSLADRAERTEVAYAMTPEEQAAVVAAIAAAASTSSESLAAPLRRLAQAIFPEREV